MHKAILIIGLIGLGTNSFGSFRRCTLICTTANGAFVYKESHIFGGPGPLPDQRKDSDTWLYRNEIIGDGYHLGSGFGVLNPIQTEFIDGSLQEVDKSHLGDRPFEVWSYIQKVKISRRDGQPLTKDNADSSKELFVFCEETLIEPKP